MMSNILPKLNGTAIETVLDTSKNPIAPEKRNIVYVEILHSYAPANIEQTNNKVTNALKEIEQKCYPEPEINKNVHYVPNNFM